MKIVSSSDEKLEGIASPTTMHKESTFQSNDPFYMRGSSTMKRRTSIASIVFLLLVLFNIPSYAHDFETSSGRNLSGDEEEGGSIASSEVLAKKKIDDVTYEKIYNALIFLIAIHFVGGLASYIKIPPLVGLIIIGIILGPNVLGFVPFQFAFIMLGEIGLIFQMFEAGIQVDATVISNTGIRAITLSFLGAILAVGSAIGTGFALGLNFEGAFALGVAFAQTANGTCLPILNSGGLMSAAVGQMILAATVIDDMVALTLLSVMESFAGDSISIRDFMLTLFAPIGWLFVLGFVAVFVAPRIIEDNILTRVRKKKERVFGLFILMAIFVAGYLPVLNYSGASYLIGAFLSGMTFSKVDTAKDLFVEYGSDMVGLFMKFFFAATIGFQIPVQIFGSGKIWYRGLLLTVTAVILKGGTALLVPRFQQDKGTFNSHRRDQVVVAFSMMCRGGFGYMISSIAYNQGLIDNEWLAASVLALLIGTIVPPIFLHYFINKYETIRQEALAIEKEALEKEGQTPLFFKVTMKTKSAWGLLSKAMSEINSLGISVKDYKSSHTNGAHVTVTTEFYLKDNTMNRSARGQIQGAITVSFDENLIHAERTDSFINNPMEVDLNADHKIVRSAQQRMESTFDVSIDARLEEIAKHLQEQFGKMFKMTLLEIFIWDPYDINQEMDKCFLSREDGRELSKEFFHNFYINLDKDGHGSIYKDELLQGLRASKFKISDEGFVVLLKEVDTDNDGYISAEEWDIAISDYLDKKAILKQSLRYSLVKDMDWSGFEESSLEA